MGVFAGVVRRMIRALPASSVHPHERVVPIPAGEVFPEGDVVRWPLGYHPHLDGLRGLAIALVLLHHGQLLTSGSGGTVGVTSFFVLSGYLITSLLLEEHARTGSVAVVSFCLRRAQRLLPALGIVLLASTLALALAGRLDLVAASTLGPASYAANWLLVATVDLGPMSHAWSLAIEGQFYLLWPLSLLFLLPRLGRPRLALALVFVALAVTVARSYAVLAGWPEHRYGWASDLQADGLLIGCVLALVPSRLPRHRLLLPAGAIGLILLSLSPETIATWSLTIIAASAVIAGGRQPDRVFGRALSFAPLRMLGRISYGAYLWHYVVMWHAGVMDGQPQPVLAAATIMMAILVAGASYQWVEAPILKGRRRPKIAQPVAGELNTGMALP